MLTFLIFLIIHSQKENLLIICNGSFEFEGNIVSFPKRIGKSSTDRGLVVFKYGRMIEMFSEKEH